MSFDVFYRLVDLATIASIVAGVGTIFLASATTWLVLQNRRQVQALVRQGLVLKNQQQPVLVVKDFRFERNNLQITIQNAGNGIASSVVLNAMFVPAERIIVEDADSFQPIEKKKLFQAMVQGKQVYMRYVIKPPKLKYEKENAYPYHIAIFLTDKHQNAMELMPGQIATFSPEVRFLIRFQPNLPTGKAMTYPEIREFLNSNGVNFIGVSIAVRGKDMAENLIQARGICSFMADLKQDESIENAFANNIHADFFTLYPNEVTARVGWLDGEMYDRMTTYPNTEQSFMGKDEGY